MKRNSFDSTPYLVGLFLPLLAAAVWNSGLPFSPDGDLYLHLKCGEWMASHFRFLTHDVFTYTQSGNLDETSQSWLSQVLLFFVYRLGGVRALSVLHLALVSVLIGMVFHFSFQRTKNLGVAMILAVVTLLIQNRTPGLRPLIAGQLFVFYFLLFAWEKPLTVRRVVLYFFLGLLWAELHASQLLFFPLMVGLGLSQWKNVSDRKWIFTLILGSALVGLLTPLGVDRYTYSLRLLLESAPVAQGEWAGAKPLQLLADSMVRLSLDIQDLVLVVSLLVGLVCLRKKFSIRALIFLAFTLMPLLSIRHLCFLAVPLTYFVTEVFPTLQPRKSLAFALSALLLWAFNFHESYYVIPPAEVASSVVKSMQLKGNAFNHHSWGSLLIFDQFPRIKIANDSRSVLHRKFFSSLRKWEADPSQSVRKSVLDSIPSETDILFLSTPESPAPWLSSRDWWVAFENNSVTVAIRRNERNRSNRDKAKAYLYAMGFEISEDENFRFEWAWAKNPDRAIHWLEPSPYGEWPSPGFTKLWEEKMHNFQKERGLIGKREIG